MVLLVAGIKESHARANVETTIDNKQKSSIYLKKFDYLLTTHGVLGFWGLYSINFSETIAFAIDESGLSFIAEQLITLSKDHCSTISPKSLCSEVE
jgi:hypothetical protein